MKTTISKEIHHSILVEDKDLLSLYRFISSRYKDVEIKATCVDGSSLESKDIAEVTSFDNPNYRKIRFISFRAQNDFDEQISLAMWTDRTFTSAEIEINSKNDETALYISREILNWLGDTKPWYDLLGRVSIIYVVSGLMFIWGMSNTVAQLIGKEPPSSLFAKYSIVEVVNIFILFMVIFFAVMYPLARTQNYLFPRAFL